jgi:hypothetical protein
MISIRDRIAFLRKIHLFRDLNEAELTRIAELLDEINFNEGEIIAEQDILGSFFYLIFRGKVKISRKRMSNEEQLTILVPGDYFGEIPLGRIKPRSTTAISLEETLLLRIPLKNFNEVIGQISKLKTNVELSVKSRLLAHRLKLNWLNPDETVYFISRKHPIILLRSLALPVSIFTIVSILILLVFLNWEISQQWKYVLLFLGVGFLIVDLFWIFWNLIDWSNDYYIITNQRVVWLEKVIGIVESRQESPISAILSVDVETDLVGREINYGDVVVRTYVGQLVMQNTNYPYQAARVLEDLWGRFKETSKRTEIETAKRALRERLGLPNPAPIKQPDSLSQLSTPSASKPNPLHILFGNIEWFKMRIEKHGTITYRKHWFVLLRQTWMPSFLLSIGVPFLVYRLLNIPLQQPGYEMELYVLFTLLLVLFLVSIFLWWLYQYVDWGNDRFLLTPTHVIDIDRTPFGSEKRRSAPLGSILSTESRRIGIFGQIFNYGTVYISVGSMQLTFDEVHAPVDVQREIDRRRLTRISEEINAQAESERERIIDWLITYHRDADELRREQELKDTESKSG